MGATRECARYITDLRFEMLPEKVVNRIKECLLDAIGCGIFGSSLEHCRQVRRVVERLGGNPEVLVLGTNFRTSSYLSSLVNGTQISGLEFDDVGVYNHPAATAIPAAIAVCARGGISGQGLVTALAASYEVSTRIAECTGLPPESEIGWHTPGFHGCFSSVIVAAKLMGLDEQDMHRALGVAGDIAGGGLMSTRVGGAATKRLHCGRAAATGVLAALLAQEGFTGVPDVIELEPWGYAWALSGYRGHGPKLWNLDEITQGLGENYTFPDKITFKHYSAAFSQTIIENVRELKKRHVIRPELVDRVIIGMPKFHSEFRVRREVDDISSANYSQEYGAALALSYDLPPLYESPVSLSLLMEKVRDPAIHDLMSKTEVRVDEEMNRENPYAIDTVVEVRLKDGQILRQASQHERHPISRGAKHLPPLTRAEVHNKFRNVVSTVIPKDVAETLIDAVEHIQECRDVARVFETCATA